MMGELILFFGGVITFVVSIAVFFAIACWALNKWG